MLGSVVVEVESESGVVGVGVSTGGLPAAFLVERHLARFVEGERADRIELMWDRMWRASLFYGRKGLARQRDLGRRPRALGSARAGCAASPSIA